MYFLDDLFVFELLLCELIAGYKGVVVTLNIDLGVFGGLNVNVVKLIVVRIAVICLFKFQLGNVGIRN